MASSMSAEGNLSNSQFDQLYAHPHAMASGQLHFPGITPPPEAAPVRFDAERSAQNARSVRMKRNREWSQRGGKVRTEDYDRDQVRIPLVKVHDQPLYTGAFAHTVFRRLGKVEELPVSSLVTAQPEISEKRVAELRKNPSLGSTVRLPPGDELPYVERAESWDGDIRHVVLNGNHRVHAQKDNGQMFIKARVVDSRSPQAPHEIALAEQELQRHLMHARYRYNQRVVYGRLVDEED